MQRLPSKGKSTRPQLIQVSQSYANAEPSESPTKPRSRSSTVVYGPAQVAESPLSAEALNPPILLPLETTDIFERPTPDDAQTDPLDAEPLLSFAGDGYEELPIEIQSLMERFLESLALRVQPIPLSMDRLSELYQDFYEHAHAQIAIHIASVSARMSRDQSPSQAPPTGRQVSGRGTVRKNSRPLERVSNTDPLSAEHQMLTASEITDKRKAKRQLELKRVAMEEAVERGVCEKVYPRIWRHRSTDDEARDEKLRSRAAALSVVGVDLKELLSSALSETVNVDPDLNAPEEDEASTPRSLLSSARQSLESMNAERYPLGKLDHLVAVHKHVVEALQQMFPSTSSADEVLPTLIYTIITSPPESNNIISNFNFIQRFRMSSKIDGEAAYCLTNLEAAITFLETVDLSSIRPDEAPQGPGKPSSRPSTPRVEIQDPMYRGLPGDTLAPPPPVPTDTKPTSPSTRARSLSSLMNTKPRSLETTSGKVIHSADAAFENIQHALDGGFRYLLGRMKEKQAAALPHNSPTVAAPKTLEDARKLVSASSGATGDDDASIGESATSDTPDDSTKKPEDKVLNLVGGRRLSGQSTDSNRSGGPAVARKAPVGVAATGQQVGVAAVESMRSLGNSLNPLKSFAGMGMMRPFSRSTTPSGSVVSPGAAPGPGPATAVVVTPTAVVGEEEKPEPFSWESIAPPIPRFVEMKEPKEMNFYDIELLLRDYQRLAGALNASRAGLS